jgi:DNA polymerase-1
LENIIFTEFGENLEKFEDQFKKRDINDLEIVSIEEKALFLSRRSYLIKRLETVLDERLKNDKGDGKCACSKITIVREISLQEFLSLS